MTKEECIGLLNRYAEYNGIGIVNLAGCREAMRMAAELLQQPSLPSNLDEAAQEILSEKYPLLHNGSFLTEREMMELIKAGAEWMAGQGETHELIVESPVLGPPMICCPVHADNGDKVVVQIRKK